MVWGGRSRVGGFGGSFAVVAGESLLLRSSQRKAAKSAKEILKHPSL
jgi:hypothetical protein